MPFLDNIVLGFYRGVWGMTNLSVKMVGDYVLLYIRTISLIILSLSLLQEHSFNEDLINIEVNE